MKNSYITATDQFCGAGGSSIGATKVLKPLGGEVKLAMNHWKLAIETHNTNFPNTDHVCTDISACDPRRYPSTDILITSPECTVHSPAGGGQSKKKMYGNQIDLNGRLASDVAEERSRATMWDVSRFAEYHRYNIIIVENVIEARKWENFEIWLLSLTNLGYNYKIKYINSMHAHPTPQSRDRMYCVFWRKGNKEPDLNFNPVAHCHHCAKNVEAYQWWKEKPKKSLMPREHGKYKTQYLFKCPDCNNIVEPYFYAAFNCIDWSKPGTKIGDRKKKLSPKTLERCEYGINKYWDQPSFVNVKFSSGVDFRVKPVADDPLTTQPGDAAVGIVNPMIISSRYIQGIGNRVKESLGPLPVQVTDGRESVLFPPLIGSSEYGGKINSSATELHAQTEHQNKDLIYPPLVIDGGWHTSKRIDQADRESMSTQDTGQTKGLLFPMIVKNYGGKPQVNTTDDALGAVTRIDHHGLLTPLVVENHGTSKARPSSDRLPALTTNAKHGIITDHAFNSFIAHYYGGSKVTNHITEAMKTFATVEGAAMVTPDNIIKPRIEDCYYRMLLAPEIQLGMGFDGNYIVLGDSKQKVKQLGNAVTPPVMEFLVSRCVNSLL